MSLLMEDYIFFLFFDGKKHLFDVQIRKLFDRDHVSNAQKS